MQSWLKAEKIHNTSVRAVVREFKAKAFNELKDSIYFIPDEKPGKNAVEDDIRTPRMDDIDDPSCLAIGKSLLPLGCEKIQVYVAGNKMIFRIGTQEEVAEKKEISPYIFRRRSPKRSNPSFMNCAKTMLSVCWLESPPGSGLRPVFP